MPGCGLITSFLLDARGNAIARIDSRGFTHRATFNALDEVVETEAPEVDDASQARGFLRRYAYDANGNEVLEEIENWTTDPATHLPRVVAAHRFFENRRRYDILDQLIEETRDATRDAAIPTVSELELLTTRYRYDANGNLARAESPLAVAGVDTGAVVTHDHDARDLRIATTRGTGAAASTTTYGYDRNGNLIAATDAEDNDGTPGGETETTAYDGFDRRRSVTDRAGTVRTYTYDPDDRVVREVVRGAIGDGQTGILGDTTRSYDELGRLVEVARLLAYPKSPGNPPSSLAEGPLRADGRVNEQFDYDENRRLVARATDNGAATIYVYDGAGRVIEEVHPVLDPRGGGDPTRTIHAYDGNGNRVRTTERLTDPDGITPALDLVTTRVFDALDRQVRETDAKGQTVYFEHDSRSNIVSAYDARGSQISDPLGLHAGGINDRGNAVRFSFDGQRRLWRTARELTTTGEGGAPLDTSNPFNPDGLVTTITTRDGNDRVTSERDDTGAATTYAYDSLGRRTAQANADGGSRRFSYDRDDNVVSLVDENGTTHAYEYDAAGRATRHSVVAASPPRLIAGTTLPLIGGTTLQTFVYDGLSRVARATDNNEPADGSDDWVVTWAYDTLGRVVEETQNGRAVKHGYESATRTKLHYPNGLRVVEYGYDAADQLRHMQNTTSILMSMSPIGVGCPCGPTLEVSFKDPAKPTVPIVTDAREFDQSSLVTRIEQFGVGGLRVGELSVARDRSENVVSTSRLARGCSIFAENLTVKLDSLGRQVRFDSSFTTSYSFGTDERTVVLDGAQNVRRVLGRNGVVIAENTPSATHESSFGGLLSHSGGVGPGTGARSADPSFIYRYDGLDRLIEVRKRNDPSVIVARYHYDASFAIAGGRRVEKVVSQGGPLDGTTRFYYDGAHCIEETSVVAGAEKVARQFLFGSAQDDVKVMDADTDGDGVPDKMFIYLVDQLGSPTQLFEKSGLPREVYSYDFRGKPTIMDAVTLGAMPASAAGNPYLFTGQRYDPETGLYYYKARYYDPVFGVFLTRDPLGAFGDAGNHGNPTAYVGGRAWNARDPSGLREIDALDAGSICNCPGVSMMDCLTELQAIIGAYRAYVKANPVKVAGGKGNEIKNKLEGQLGAKRARGPKGNGGDDFRRWQEELDRLRKELAQYKKCYEWQQGVFNATRAVPHGLLGIAKVEATGTWGAREAGEHNWVEVAGPCGKKIILDPWRDGRAAIYTGDDDYYSGRYVNNVEYEGEAMQQLATKDASGDRIGWSPTSSAPYPRATPPAGGQ